MQVDNLTWDIWAYYIGITYMCIDPLKYSKTSDIESDHLTSPMAEWSKA